MTQTQTQPLSLEQRASARAAAYALLAKLLVRGVDDVTLQEISTIEALATHLPPRPDLDELAADHHRLLLHELFPYAGVFIDSEATTGGAATTAVLDSYRRFGFTPRLDDLAADHLGVELGALGFLCGAEAEAVEDDEQGVASHLRRLQRDFLDAHVLTWLPPLLGAAASYRSGFWPAVITLTAELIADHRAALAGADIDPRRSDQTPEVFEAGGPNDQDDVVELLTDPKTGLREIAEYLLTPRRSGLFISRDDLRSLGRGSELPSGFGARRLMLTNLLRAAADYDSVPALLARLEHLVAKRAAAYDLVARELGLEMQVAPWSRRLSHTRQLLRRVGRVAVANS